MIDWNNKIKPAGVGEGAITKRFFAAFLIGSALVGVSSALGLSLYLAIGGPAFVVIFYAVYARKAAVQTRAFEQMGDSCYYLGFLLTLVALLFGLILDGDGGDTVDMGGLLAKFGTSLITTVIGLIARVGIVQFRLPDDEVEDKNQADMLATGQMLKAEMEIAIKDFQEARKAILERINNAARQSENRLKQSSEKQAELLEKLADESLNRMASILGEMEKRFAEIKIDPAQITKPIADAMSGLKDPLDELGAIIKSATVAVDDQLTVLSETQQDVTGRMSSFKEETEKTTKASEAVRLEWSTIQTELASAASALSEVGHSAAALSGLNQAVRDFTAQMTVAMENQNTIQETFLDYSASAKEARTNFESEVQAIKALRENLAEEVDTANNAVSDVFNHMTKAAQKMRKTIEGETDEQAAS